MKCTIAVVYDGTRSIRYSPNTARKRWLAASIHGMLVSSMASNSRTIRQSMATVSMR
ncbi:hypothetical protein D3C80_1765170 [compost metagenome]